MPDLIEAQKELVSSGTVWHTVHRAEVNAGRQPGRFYVILYFEKKSFFNDVFDHITVCYNAPLSRRQRDCLVRRFARARGAYFARWEPYGGGYGIRLQESHHPKSLFSLCIGIQKVVEHHFQSQWPKRDLHSSNGWAPEWRPASWWGWSSRWGHCPPFRIT